MTDAVLRSIPSVCNPVTTTSRLRAEDSRAAYFPPANPCSVRYLFTIAQIKNSSGSSLVMYFVRSGGAMDTNQRQIALSVLESLRSDLMYAHLNDGNRVLDVADLRQYIYEQMGRIRTTGLVMDGLYGTNGQGQDITKNNGHNGKAHS